MMRRIVETKVISKGVGLGSTMAMIISWSVNHSFWWMLLHGIFSWIYVIYYFCGFGRN